jgi:pimeloyl-ACP methyl ester carboxylesterase
VRASRSCWPPARPARAAGVFFFARNMDPGGTKKVEPSPVIDRCFARYRRDYASLSATPDGFEPFAAAVGEMMRTQSDYTARDLAAIDAPVAIVQGDHDEFIRPEHAAYLARTMPVGTLTILPGVSHFAPLQRPARFNAALPAFLDGLPR